MSKAFASSLTVLTVVLCGCPAAPPADVEAGFGVFFLATFTAEPSVPPVADRLAVSTSPDQTVAAGSSVSLLGIVRGGEPPFVFTWERVSGPEQRLSGETSPVATVGGLNYGRSQFRLKVRDFVGATATSDVDVTVVPPSLPQSGQAVPAVQQ